MYIIKKVSVLYTHKVLTDTNIYKCQVLKRRRIVKSESVMEAPGRERATNSHKEENPIIKLKPTDIIYRSESELAI